MGKDSAVSVKDVAKKAKTVFIMVMTGDKQNQSFLIMDWLII